MEILWFGELNASNLDTTLQIQSLRKLRDEHAWIEVDMTFTDRHFIHRINPMDQEAIYLSNDSSNEP